MNRVTGEIALAFSGESYYVDASNDKNELTPMILMFWSDLTPSGRESLQK